MNETPRHKVFISYHHDEDEGYKTDFCRLLAGDFVDKSVEDGDISPYLPTDRVRQQIRDNFIADATVTVVLIGKCTWQRKHIDWEIGSSLRATQKNPRCGLLGILLPTHYNYGWASYSGRLIPPRLADNCEGRISFADTHHWPYYWDSETVRKWIHEAFERRNTINPVNNRPQFKQNRSGPCENGWQN